MAATEWYCQDAPPDAGSHTAKCLVMNRDFDGLREQFPCPTCVGVGYLGLFSAMSGKACPTCEGSGIELPAHSDSTGNDANPDTDSRPLGAQLLGEPGEGARS